MAYSLILYEKLFFMRYIIPVVNIEELKFKIAETLNLNHHMCLYDIETDKMDWIQFSNITNWTEMFREHNIDGIVTRNINVMALKLLTRNKFIILHTENDSVNDTIKSLCNNELKIFTEENISSDSCSGTCTTCDTQSTCSTDKNQDLLA